MPDTTTEISHGYAQIGGVRLHYAHAGEGERLVLLLHGFPEFWYSWRHQIAALSDEFTVVAPDLRGYNLSDKPARVEDYQIDKLVDDVTGLVRHLGFEQAAVVGHDWGAAVAWAAALRHPDTISKIAALQVPPPAVWRKNLSVSQLLRSWYMFFFQIPRVPEFVLSQNDFAALERGLKSNAKPETFTDEDIAEFKKSWRETDRMTSPINFYRANFYRRFLARLPDAKIKVPTLFIFGEQDFAILPETVRDVQSAIDAPYTEFRLPDAGHWVQQEAPEDVTLVLRDFLND